MIKSQKVILTGFEPFGDYKYNPTKEAVNYYNGKIIFGREVIGIVLPCTYFAFDYLCKIIEDVKPVAIVSMGLSSVVKGIRIETTFRNLMWSKYTDSNGYNPDREAIDKGVQNKEFLSSFADNTYLANLLHRNHIPVEISGDANAFICNSLGYLTTKKIMDDDLVINNIFLHVPWTDDYEEVISLESDKIFLEKDKLYDAIEILIENI